MLAVLLVDEFEFDRDGGFDFFAFQHFVRGLYADFADFFWLLCDGRGHFAAFDGFDAVIGAVEADEDEVFFARGLDGAQGAERHFVVLREDALYFGLGGEQVFHDVQPFAAVKVGRLAGKDFEVVRLGGFGKARAAFARGGDELGGDGGRQARCAWRRSFRRSSRIGIRQAGGAGWRG